MRGGRGRTMVEATLALAEQARAGGKQEVELPSVPRATASTERGRAVVARAPGDRSAFRASEPGVSRPAATDPRRRSASPRASDRRVLANRP